MTDDDTPDPLNEFRNDPQTLWYFATASARERMGLRIVWFVIGGLAGWAAAHYY